MRIPNLNFIYKSIEFGNSSLTYAKDLAITCTSRAYRYGENAVDTIQQKVVPRISAVIEYAIRMTAAITAMVALRALATLISSLPGINLLAIVIIAVYACRHPRQCADLAAISAINLVAMKTLALLLCPVSGMQDFIVYTALLVCLIR